VHNTLSRQCGALPFFPKLPKTYAEFPVWKDSTTKPVRFEPMTRKHARQLYDAARRFEHQTRQPGHQDGAIGRNGLAVLYSLLFDFLNYRTGRLDPSQAKIADKANISERSVARGLDKLKAAGVLNWLRRCEEVVGALGGFLMRQISNAYAVLPCSQWRGYKPPAEPPKPAPGTWGARPPEDPYGEATRDGDMLGRITALEGEAATGSSLSAAIAKGLRRSAEILQQKPRPPARQ
jgi:hypothetical protein